MKKKKKIIIISIIVVLLVVFIVSRIIKAKNKSEELDYEVGKIEKQTLINSISSTGTVKTEESKNVTSVLAGYKVTGVNVKVGDVVEVGDTLVTFDTDTLQKSVTDLSASINATKQQTNISIAGADRAVQDAQNAKNYGLDSAKSAKDQAQAAYDNATATYNSTNNQIANLQSQIASLEPIVGQYKNAQADVATKQATYNEAEKAYNNATSTVGNSIQASDNTLPTNTTTVGGLEINNLKETLDNANTALQTSKLTLSGLEPSFQQYTALTGELAKLNSALPSLKSAVDQTKSAYETAEKAYNNTSSNLDSAILSAQDAAAASRISSSTATLSLEEQLTAYRKQLNEGNLKSTVSGTVTAVNVKKGDNYQGGTLLTIEGVESFIIEANVDEYDVADIEEGMEVIIKTDATRDEELKGRVIFVAPSSNESTSNNAMAGYSSTTTSATNGATYLVKIEVLSSNDRLRLGMRAKVSIITEKAENTLVVPYDAITEKEDGTKVITVINDDDTQTEIEVKIGLESGYYSEIISDKIKEGMKVVLPKVNGSTTLDDLLDSMGATGGIE